MSESLERILIQAFKRVGNMDEESLEAKFAMSIGKSMMRVEEVLAVLFRLRDSRRKRSMAREDRLPRLLYFDRRLVVSRRTAQGMRLQTERFGQVAMSSNANEVMLAVIDLTQMSY